MMRFRSLLIDVKTVIMTHICRSVVNTVIRYLLLTERQLDFVAITVIGVGLVEEPSKGKRQFVLNVEFRLKDNKRATISFDRRRAIGVHYVGESFKRKNGQKLYVPNVISRLLFDQHFNGESIVHWPARRKSQLGTKAKNVHKQLADLQVKS